MKPTLLKLLEENLKNKYNSQVADVWGKTFDVIAVVFQSGVEEYKNEKDNK